jgi:hypothetical protein
MAEQKNKLYDYIKSHFRDIAILLSIYLEHNAKNPLKTITSLKPVVLCTQINLK